MMCIYTWLSPKTNCTRKDQHHIYKSLGYSRKGFPHVPPNVLDIALVQVPAPPINGASANRRHLAGTERPPPPRPLTGVYLGPSSASRAHLEPQRVPHEQNARTCGPIKTPCVRASDRGRVFPSFGSTPSKHRIEVEYFLRLDQLHRNIGSRSSISFVWINSIETSCEHGIEVWRGSSNQSKETRCRHDAGTGQSTPSSSL